MERWTKPVEQSWQEQKRMNTQRLARLFIHRFNYVLKIPL